MRGNIINGIDISKHTKLVDKVVSKYKWGVAAGVGLDDMHQAGLMGLMRAAEKYEPERCEKFSTYAYIWVKQFVKVEINNNRRSVRIPRWVMENEANREKLVHCSRDTVSIDNGAEATGSSPDDFLSSLMSGMSSHGIDSSHSDCITKIQLTQMLESTSKISQRNVDFLKSVFIEENSLTEAGRQFGVSRERTRQIVQKSIRFIREKHCIEEIGQ
jgi:RNA polymerase sigma factor (sigma-70 family)